MRRIVPRPSSGSALEIQRWPGTSVAIQRVVVRWGRGLSAHRRVGETVLPSFPRKRESGLPLLSALVLGAVAKTDSHPCAFRPPSWRPSYFLLLAQKKVTKEKGTLASAVCRASLPANYPRRPTGSARGHTW